MSLKRLDLFDEGIVFVLLLGLYFDMVRGRFESVDFHFKSGILVFETVELFVLFF